MGTDFGKTFLAVFLFKILVVCKRNSVLSEKIIYVVIDAVRTFALLPAIAQPPKATSGARRISTSRKVKTSFGTGPSGW